MSEKLYVPYKSLKQKRKVRILSTILEGNVICRGFRGRHERMASFM